MIWNGYLNGYDLSEGTGLTLTETTIEGEPPSEISVGDEIAVEYPNNTRAKLTVTAKSGNEIEASFGKRKFRLERQHNRPFKHGGLHAQSWKVLKSA